MNSMLYTPPQIVAYLRDALHSVIKQVAERIVSVADWSREEQCPGWYVEHLERVERVSLCLRFLVGARGIVPVRSGSILTSTVGRCSKRSKCLLLTRRTTSMSSISGPPESGG